MATQPPSSSVSDAYAPRLRHRNIALLEAILDAADDVQFEEACDAAAADFHPSLLSEIDWRNFCAVRSGGQPLVGLAEYVFLHTLPHNLVLRADQLQLGSDVLARIGRSWQAAMDAAGDDQAERFSALLNAVDDAAGAATDRLISDRFEEIRARAVADLSALNDARRVPLVLTNHLSNAHLLLLDQPVTRLDAVELRDGDYLIGPPVGSADQTRAWLAELAHDADQVGLTSLGTLVRQLLDEVDWPDVVKRQGFDGERADGTGPCARCAMNFTSEALVSIDPRCEFFTRRGPEWIFIPAGLNVARCQFCAYETTIDPPAMCYIPQRQQVVYSVPTQRTIGRTEAIDIYGPVIQGIRSRYLESLDDAQRREFDAASELVVESWDDFLHAIHMGETVDEDHVHSLLVVGDGTGMIVDIGKRFQRELSVSEMQRLTAPPEGE